MRAFRITGTNLKTKRREVANVMGETMEQAMKLMWITHYRLVCLDKRGVDLDD